MGTREAIWIYFGYLACFGLKVSRFDLSIVTTNQVSDQVSFGFNYESMQEE